MKITNTWTGVDLDRMERNLAALRACARDGIEVLRLTGANAYTFEPMPIGPMQGVCPQFLAVRSIEDGETLRARGVTFPILVLDYPNPANVAGYVKRLHRAFLAQSVPSAEAGRALAMRVIPAYGGVISVHLKVRIEPDGGSFSYWDEETDIGDIISVKSSLGMYCEGVYTELSAEDDEDTRMLKVKKLNALANRLGEITGKPVPVRHVFVK